ncbi:MAG: hypothetical protein NUV47_01000 [Patescibacteria group bacterium]|nr:hypothetical protein [Patescibacteria group bacterium]
MIGIDIDVETILEIIYSHPESFFNSSDTHSRILRGSVRTPFGVLTKVESNEFKTKVSFIGFAGDERTGRYAIVVNLLVDSDRPRSVFIYTFEVSLGSNIGYHKIF